MGTSVSQPSPKGRSPEGKSWNAVRKAFHYSEPPHLLFTKIFKAFTSEYHDTTPEKIIDRGVVRVVQALRNVNYTNLNQVEKYRAIGNFTAQARRELAQSGSNSFFAELAISCASATILSGDDLDEKFSNEFLAKVMDYILSRDLPMLIGSEGVMNLESLKTLLEGLKAYIETIVPSEVEFDCIDFLKNQIATSGEDDE